MPLKESAKLFNDALFDEQARMIYAYKEQLSHLAKVLHEKNLKIKKLKRLVASKEGLLSEKDFTIQVKNACIEQNNDIIDRLRKENETLRKKNAENVTSRIDAQALKSAESALAYKEKVIAEKDEVIDDLCKELAEKNRKLETIRELICKYNYPQKFMTVDEMIKARRRMALPHRCLTVEWVTDFNDFIRDCYE